MIRRLMPVGLLSLGLLCPTHGESRRSPSNEPATRDSASERVFPTLIRKMLQWPDEQAITARFTPTKKPFWPLDNTLEWVNKVIVPDWLPQRDLRADVILIRKEYGPLSASHVRWHKNGYEVQVTQTRGIIVIKLTPLTPQVNRQTRESMLDYARSVAQQVFPDAYVVPAWVAQNNQMKDIHKTILDYSFTSAWIREVPGGLAAAPWHQDTKLEGRLTKDPVQPPVRMWYSYIGWYTDGSTVAYWTFKMEGDSWICPAVCTADPVGDKWF